jgi:hypothetical protein
VESTLGAADQQVFRGRSCEAALRSKVQKHGAPGKLLMSRRPPGFPERARSIFLWAQLVTEGARVKQVGEEPPRRAVV